MNKLFYTTDMMVCDLDKIHRALHLDGLRPTVVYGITRGGLIPAVYASHYYEVPMETIKVTTYDGNELGDCTDLIKRLKAGEMVLLVDDICDTGNTLKYIVDSVIAADTEGADLLNTLIIATLIHNEGCNLIEPDYAGTVINKTENPTWVVFDWEY